MVNKQLTYYRDRALRCGSISGGDGSWMLPVVIPDGLDCWSFRMLVTKLIPELCWVNCDFTLSSKINFLNLQVKNWCDNHNKKPQLSLTNLCDISVKCIHTHIHNQFTALWILSGTTRVSRYQKKHSPMNIYHGHQLSLICFLHLL